MKTIRIGSGAGYSGDRIEPAIELAEKGDINYLVFECLAERTIALAQQARLKDPASGYDPLLQARMQAVLAICHAKGIKIIHSPNGHDSSAPQVSEDQRIGGLKQVGFGVEYVVHRCERRQNSIAFLNDIIGFDW